jgi:rfaE bifunctional protein kinase chain/domain
MAVSNLEAILKEAKSKRFLVIGDLMLDKFIKGSVTRISPEAPVPVVQVASEEYFPGGAANVARNIQTFGASVSVAGMVGGENDKYGQRLRELLTAAQIDPSLSMERRKFFTTIKTRIIANHQHLLRLDRDTVEAPSESEVKDFVGKIGKKIEQFDALIFEDYGKGFLTEEMVAQLAQEARRAGKIVAADPNPRHPMDWHDMTLVKPNRSEAFKAAGIIHREPVDHPAQDKDLLRAGAALLEKWRPQYLLISLGEQGMMLFEKNKKPYHIPTKAQDVYDVSGAGDTALALFTLSLASGASAIEAAEIANHACAIVIGKVGTATLTPAELRESFAEDSRRD